MTCEQCGERGIFEVEQSGRLRRLLCGRCTRSALAGLDPMAARFFENWLPVRELIPSSLGDLPDSSVCLDCGTTFAEFERGGLVGCPLCYQVFGSAIVPALKILHQSGGGSNGG